MLGDFGSMRNLRGFFLFIGLALMVPVSHPSMAGALPPSSQMVTPGREQYNNIRLDVEPMLDRFTRPFEKARQDGESWTKSPAQIALRLSRADFQLGAETLSVTHVRNGGGTVIVSSGTLADDSIARVEYRVDFSGLGHDVQSTSVKIAWAGKRWKCWRPSPPHWIRPGILCP
jgi:hypothetical protein